MKLYPPPPADPDEARTRRRIPAFHPVRCDRHDGWTAARQGAFVGMLAQTGSVVMAARSVSMGRESAYRLRRRSGAAGFAAAWDAALGKSHTPVDLASTKATGLMPHERLETGLLQVRMHVGRYAGSHWKFDANALLQHTAQVENAGRMVGEDEQRSHALKPECV